MFSFWIFALFCAQVNGQGFYKAVGPRAIRPNSEYHVAVSVQATSEPTTVTATLQGVSYNGSFFTNEDRIVVQPYNSRICRLEVGDIEKGDYKLIVSGRGGVDFISDFPLEFVEKSYSVFIQTDRGVYKPGTKILFRAIVLNSQLKPAAEVRNELLHIHVSDGQGNRVKEWRRVEALRGVFTGEVKLSERPVLGNWNISVTIHGQTFSKSVEVAEYILPKFMVSIQAPKHLTFRENVLVANIQTQYSYGKKVKGEATVTVYPTFFSGVIQPIFQNPIRKVLPIEGSATVEFDIEKDLKLSDEYERAVMMDVVVEEASTGRRQNNSIEVHVHKYSYKMDLIKTADYFKPGLKYTAFVKVTNHDGTPLKSDRNEVTVRHGYSRADEVYVEEKHKLDKNGVVKLEYFTPANVTNTTALRIEAQYQDLKERISPIPAAVSYSNTFLQASLETDRPIVNLDVEVAVNCTEPLKYIEYVLMGRGDVLIANTFQVDNEKEFRFHFTATHAMVPVSHLIVSYVKSDGELVGDTLDIEVDGLLQNFLEIQVNPVETEPSLDIDITIRSQPNSYIALLAVDQNVHHLRQGFDVTHNQVAEELKRYDVASQSPYPIMRDSKYHFFWKPGGANPHSAIYDSGADLLTNSHIFRHKPTLEDIYLRPVSYGTSTVKPDRGFGLSLQKITRPPLAGPYAFSRIPKPVWNKPKVYLNDYIADTWLFTNFSNGYEGKTSIRRRVPSSLNTWVISGFSLDPLHGLGLATNPKKVKVSKGFVVSLDLPYSIQRGEILAVPVVVYNHNNEDITAEVTLHNPEHLFEFAELTNNDNVNATKKIVLYRRKKIAIKKNSGNSVSFMITPINQGSIEIKVTANSPKSQDVATKRLLVTAEGEPEYYTKTVLIDLRKNPNFKQTINLTLPKNLVSGSEKIEVSAVGDLLGPTMVNLEHLIQLPTGCGEQNLVHIMPSLIVLKYLKSTRQITPTIENEAVDLLERSYQQQLSYRREDGSFSAFGSRDKEASVWLTAYVALALKQAKPFIYVDDNVIKAALDWLVENQGKNGSFVETGAIIHHDLQNKNGNSLALTAFTLLAFIENQNSDRLYTNAINRGLDYIARNIGEEESSYTLAICSYLLQLAKHASKQGAFNLLDARSKSGNNMKWWAKDKDSEKKNPWDHLPKSIDIETTAYGLLTFLEANYLDDAVPVLNWLVDQQNSFGGFTSSHDTVVGLYAVFKLIAKLSTNVNMQIEFTSRKQETSRFHVNKNNAMIVQKLQLRKDVRQVNVTAQGSGLALFRVSYQYNMNVTGPWPMFTLDPQVDKNTNRDHLQISICTAFVSRNLSESRESNMAVMEVNLPSGFTADTDSLPSLEVSQGVQKVETSHGLTRVVLYFNNITSIFEYCPTVSAFRTHKVAKLKPVPVIIYDYYDSSRRARLFYRGRRATLCNICENEDCGDVCKAEADSQIVGESREAPDGKGSATCIDSTRFSFVIVLCTILYNRCI